MPLAPQWPLIEHLTVVLPRDKIEPNEVAPLVKQFANPHLTHLAISIEGGLEKRQCRMLPSERLPCKLMNQLESLYLCEDDGDSVVDFESFALNFANLQSLALVHSIEGIKFLNYQVCFIFLKYRVICLFEE